MAKKKKKTKKSAKKAKKSTAKKAKKTTKKKKVKKKPAKKVAKKKTTKKVAKKAKKAKKKPTKKVKKKPAKKVAKKKATLSSKISKKLKDVGSRLTSKSSAKAKRVEPKAKPKKAKKAVAALVMGKQTDDSENAEHEVFSAQDMVFFKELLTTEKQKILDKAREILKSGNMELDRNEMSDEVDLASATIEQNLQFRLLDRDRKLLGEIEHAISKIETGDFGYCEGTGEIIPKRRLELRPWTRHSVKFKEQLEKMKKSGRGVADDEGENYGG